MIVVDSSVWIANSRDLERPAVRRLRAITRPTQIIVGDIVLLEVLRGARSEKDAQRLERELGRFQPARMLGPSIAIAAARHYRLLRGQGLTLNKVADLIIASFCVAEGCLLLHDDRDFGRLVEPLGLQILSTAGW